LSELVLVNKEKESIDNGDVGSTKDYPSENEDECMDVKIPQLEKYQTFKTCYDEPELDTVDYIVDNSDDL
jgi:hypothetical protein